MAAYYRLVDFVPAHPGWMVHVSSWDHTFTLPLAGWVIQEWLDEDDPEMPRSRRVVPGWVTENEIQTAHRDEEVWVVAPGEMVHQAEVHAWHNAHAERVKARLAAGDRFAFPD